MARALAEWACRWARRASWLAALVPLPEARVDFREGLERESSSAYVIPLEPRLEFRRALYGPPARRSVALIAGAAVST
jgi:hypothetical protein